MSITLSAATWAAIIEQPDSATRAQALVDLLGANSTIEFLDAADAVIRTITAPNWTVDATANGKTPITPSSYTDAALGSGTPVAAVFKDSVGTEVFRCSCGTGAGNFYRLLANIVAGVPIIPGAFAVAVSAPESPVGTIPSATVSPTISVVGGGAPQVGAILTASNGIWTGNPTPVVTAQWMRSGAPIAGETSLTYQLQDADDGKIITRDVTGSNSAGVTTVTSNAIGPVFKQNPFQFNEGAVSEPIYIQQGSTYNLSAALSGGVTPYKNFAVDAGTLESGKVTFDADTGVISVAAGATLGDTAPITFGADDSAPTGGEVNDLPTISLKAATAGTYDYTFGQVFKKGAVPAGTKLKTSAAQSQVDWLQTWSDGSLLQAAVTVREPLTSTAKQITFSQDTSTPGAALTLADLIAANPQASVQFTDAQDLSYDPAVPFVFRAALRTGEVTNLRATSNTGTGVTFGTVSHDPVSGEAWVTVTGGNPGVCQLRLACDYLNSKQEIETAQYSIHPLARAGGGMAWDAASRAMVPANATKFISNTTVQLSSLLSQVNGGEHTTPGLVKQRISGPLMSEWKFYSGRVANSDLCVFFTVRLYASGRYWVRTTVENGWLKLPNPMGYKYSASLSVGGAVKWSTPSIEHPHHARWSLPFWSTDTDIVPSHDTVYLRASKLVPNYIGGYVDIPNATLFDERANVAKQAQTCLPMERANQPNLADGFASGGGGSWIGPMPTWDVTYIVAPHEERAWRGMLANAEAFNRYSYHYRDETTLLPTRPTMHPTAGIPDLLAGISSGYNNNDKLPTPSGFAPVADFAMSHHPAPPYLAALMTGDDHYAEECAFLMVCIFGGAVGNRSLQMPINPWQRGLRSYIQYDSAVRAYSWTIRSFCMAARVSTDPEIRDELIELLGREFDRSRRRSIDGTLWPEWNVKNNLGIVYWGGGDGLLNGYMFEQVWMHLFNATGYGLGWDMDLPFSPQQKDDFLAVRNFIYTMPVGLLGDATGYCFRRSFAYSLPLGQNSTPEGDPGFATSFADLYNRLHLATGLQPPATCNYGDSLLRSDSDVESTGKSIAGNHGAASLSVAINYAVEHGAPGALEAHTRAFGSSTMTKPGTGPDVWVESALWSVWARNLESPL